MPRLSIVIPVRGTLELLEDTLVSVLEHRPDDCEIIVALDSHYDDPYQLQGEVRFIRPPGGTSVVALANAALAAAASPIVHVLLCGSQVSDGWTQPALAHFADTQVAAVAPLIVASRADATVVSAGIAYFSGGARREPTRWPRAAAGPSGSPTVLGASLLAGFFRRDVLLREGTMLDAAVGDQLADVDLALRLCRAGYRARLEPASIVHRQHAGLSPGGAAAAGRHAQRLFWRNAPAVGWLRALALHGLAVAADTLASGLSWRTVARLLGRAVACGELRHYRRHHRLLAELAAERSRLPDESASGARPPEVRRPLAIDLPHAPQRNRPVGRLGRAVTGSVG